MASLGVFLLGIAMRWIGLARLPFEQDELYTLQESRDLFSTNLLPGIDARPLYYLIHHSLTPILPPGELGARLPAFLFGLLGLFVTWMLGRYLLRGPGGFLALILCALSPWHLFISGEARYWSLVYLLAVSALLAILSGRETDKWGTHALASLFLILGSLTHPTFVFPIIGIAPFLGVDRQQDSIRYRFPSTRSLLATWFPTVLIVGGYWISLKVIGRGDSLSNLSGRGLSASLVLLPAIVQLVTPGLCAAAAVGIVAASRSSSIRATRVSVLGVGGLVAGTGLLFAASFRTDVYADYGVSMLPLLFAGATSVLLVPGLTRTGPIALGLAVILTGAMLPETVSQLTSGMRFDYRPAFNRILREGPDLPALVWPVAIQVHYAPTLHGTEFGHSIAQLDSLASTVPSFWVVGSATRRGLVGDSGGILSEWLNEHCRLESSYAPLRFDYREYRVPLFLCYGSGRAAHTP